MSRQVNVYEAKNQLSELLEEVAAGGEVVIARNGKPVARLVPLHRGALQPRVPGAWAGRGWVGDDFDDLGGEYGEIVDELYRKLGADEIPLLDAQS